MLAVTPLSKPAEAELIAKAPTSKTHTSLQLEKFQTQTSEG
jgi:hypothetical protein